MKHFLFLAFMIFGLTLNSAAAAGNPGGGLSTLPKELDPRITKFDQPHVSWLPSGSAPRNQLLLFLPGTGGKPKPAMPLARTAASLGYHVISLMYHDGAASQKNCAKSPDPDAYMKFRLAIFRGGDFHKFHVNREDSIEERLTRLLRHLVARQPGKGWDQYVGNRGEINWEKIAVAGLSQGGGHAFVISKFHRVARVLMFGSPKDYSLYYKAPAHGFDSATKTPLDRYFAFNHMRDNGNGCTHDQQAEIFRQMGLAKLGTADADRPVSSYGHAHLIYTNVDLKGTKFHGSVLGEGSYIGHTAEELVVPVWKYMLTEPVQ
jgi:hypothetical protein